MFNPLHLAQYTMDTHWLNAARAVGVVADGLRPLADDVASDLAVLLRESSPACALTPPCAVGFGTPVCPSCTMRAEFIRARSRSSTMGWKNCRSASWGDDGTDTERLLGTGFGLAFRFVAPCPTLSERWQDWETD